MYEYYATVLRIVDGDTVDVDIDLGFDIHVKHRIRLYGIDAPETRTRDLEEKKRGFAAKDRVVELCPVGTRLKVRTMKDTTGKYGRVLGELYLDDQPQSLNKMLVDEGLAERYYVRNLWYKEL